jgi:hypothetical protein
MLREKLLSSGTRTGGGDPVRVSLSAQPVIV